LAPPAFSKTLTFVNNLVRPDATQNTPVLRLLSGIGNIRLSAPGYPPLFPLPSLEKVVRLLAVYFLSTFGKKFASNWNQRSESASNCVQNCTFYRSISGVEASKANCINRSYGAGDGNRTHVRSLGSFYTAIVRRPLCYFRFYSIVQRGCNRFVDESRRFGSSDCFGKSPLTRSSTSWRNLPAGLRSS
jgi:hypothetical protein